MNKKQGLYAVLASVAIQLTLGNAYLWSLYQDGIASSVFGGNHANAQLTFSILLATLTMGSVIGGKLVIKYGTRTVVFIGGIILSAGFLLASFVQPGYGWLLWLTYGVMGGVGMGFTYTTTIACVQRWYPHKKGLVTGIIVSALGFGGVVFTPIIRWLIVLFGDRGVGEFNTFRVLSAVFIVVCSAGCIFLKRPPSGYMADAMKAAAQAKCTRTHTPGQMLKKPQFYLATGTFLLACMGGLMMIGFASPIAEAHGFDANVAAVAVLAISMFNSVGRFVWGMVSDRIGRKNTIMIMLAGSAVLSLLVGVVGGYGIFVLVCFIGFFYGGILGTFPTLTADLFGLRHSATNYGFVLLGFGVGAITSSQIAGYFRNLAVGYGGEVDISRMFPAFVIASGCAVAGIAMMLVLRKMQNKVRAQAES